VKLRLLDDSVRLRLSRSEVLAVAEQGSVEGRTRFPDGSAFAFSIESSNGGNAGARFADGRMVVDLPAADISAWASDDSAVSLRHEIRLPEGGPLKLLVEKDFQCIGGRDDEDQTDLFPNPDAGEC
jgi:hypothetical protein